MTLHFNKFGRIVAMAVLAGVMVPGVCLAGKNGGGKSGGGNHGSHSMKMKSSGGQFRSMPKSVSSFKSSGNNFKKLNTSSLKSNNNVWKSTPKFTPAVNKSTHVYSNRKPSGNVLQSGKFNGSLNTTNNGFKLKGRDQIKFNGGSLVTKNPGKIDYTGSPLVSKKPIIKSPIGPLLGGGHGKPIDGGIGNGNPGNGNGNHHGNHNNNKFCKPHKCPWPVFWPIYGGGNYWNSPCYYGPTCTTPNVIVNQVPPVVVSEVVPVSAEVPVAVGTSSADLVLEDVQYVEPATLLVGPAYRVKFRNQGLVAAGKFRVALIAAVDGQANEQSPQAMVEVAGLASGQSSEVTVRLPRTAMQLVGTSGETTAFTHLLVAADFDNLVSESDKANNVAIIDRTQLEVAAK